MKCALVWLPFNDPSMPPLGIANLVGYLRGKGFSIDPIDLNIDLYSQVREFFRDQPERMARIFQNWCYDKDFQQAASALAFPDHVQEVHYAHWGRQYILKILKDCLSSAARVLASGYDLVGLSITNVSFMAALALSKLIKARKSQVMIVWGGPSVRNSSAVCQLQRLGCVDLFVHGEGERPLEMILNRLKNSGGPSGITWEGIPDAIWRHGDSTGFDTHSNNFDMSVKSCADFFSFPLHIYDMLQIPIQTASGCPWARCAFCPEPGLNRYVPRPLDDVLNQITHFQKAKMKTSYYFVDNCLNSDTRRVEDICRRLQKCGNTEWTCMMRSRDLTVKLLRDMKSAGCRSIFIGLESFSDAVLQSMEKGCTKLDHLRAFRLALETNIPLKGNFMFGFPTETADDVRETIQVLERYIHLWRSCRFWISPFSVTPGSKIYENPQHYGIEVLDLGDETENLPGSIRSYVPVWNHHWRPTDSNEDVILEKCRLYHKLESLLARIQESGLPRRYLREDRRGVTVFSEDEGRTNNISRTRLTKAEGAVLKECLDIRNQEELLNIMPIKSGNINVFLSSMEERGLIATSGNKVVTTVPGLGK